MPALYHTIAVKDHGQRLDRWLKNSYPGVPFSQIQKALRKGEIRINKGRVKGRERLATGQELRLPPYFEGNQAKKHSHHGTLTKGEIDFIRSLVIYRDEQMIALNKPSGLATQGGTKTHQHVDRLSAALVDEGEERPKLVHRLDRDTSGVLLLALNRETATWLGHAFKNRTIQKHYVAMTVGIPTPSEGHINAPLIKRPTDNGGLVIVDEQDGQEAITQYKVRHVKGQKALVDLYPKTGRQHQLRAHLHHIGTPILGDTKYPTDQKADRLYLHAHAITINDQMIKADLPEGFGF